MEQQAICQRAEEAPARIPEIFSRRDANQTILCQARIVKGMSGMTAAGAKRCETPRALSGAGGGSMATRSDDRFD